MAQQSTGFSRCALRTTISTSRRLIRAVCEYTGSRWHGEPSTLRPLRGGDLCRWHRGAKAVGVASPWLHRVLAHVDLGKTPTVGRQLERVRQPLAKRWLTRHASHVVMV